MIPLTYEYKLKPTQQQAQQIDHDLEVCRRVWNYALRERKDWIASRKCPVNVCSLRSKYIIPADAPYPNFKVQCQRLTQAKQFNSDLASNRLALLTGRRLKPKWRGCMNRSPIPARTFTSRWAHQLFDAADVVEVEDLNLVGLSCSMLGKHMLDAGHGQFLNSVLPWVGFKRGKTVVKEKAAGTSQECPDCGEAVRKTLSTRWHQCPCGCSMPRDVASGLVLRNRFLGRGAHGLENAPGEVLAGGELAHASQDSENGESRAIALGLAG